MRTKRLISSVLSITILAVLVIATLQRQAIYDWFRLRNYSPPASVVSLTKATTMTPAATHVFYINHPAIEGKAEFNQNCPDNGGEHTIILGCYLSHETGIHIYSVTDPKLAGVEQVTAAHEMLHAAYERLSSKDRNYVDGLLQDYYQHNLHDKRLLATIAAYKKSEPNDVVNEMHSVFGTEAPNLPAKLETYYKKYFADRSKVVAFSTAYQATFIGRQTQANKLLTQIKQIESQLNGMKAQIVSYEQLLNAQYQDLQLAPKSTRDEQISYKNQVDAYNAKVRTYRALVSTYNTLIILHNKLVDQYQALSVETNQLLQELNSRSATVPNQ